MLPVLSRIARAQTYPTRPVRIIVSFPPGAGNDIMARLMGQALSERLGQPFIIENRPRAAGNIGAEAVVRAPPALSPRHSEARRHGPLRALCPVAAQVRDPRLRRGVRSRRRRRRSPGFWQNEPTAGEAVLNQELAGVVSGAAAAPTGRAGSPSRNRPRPNPPRRPPLSN